MAGAHPGASGGGGPPSNHNQLWGIVKTATVSAACLAGANAVAGSVRSVAGSIDGLSRTFHGTVHSAANTSVATRSMQAMASGHRFRFGPFKA